MRTNKVGRARNDESNEHEEYNRAAHTAMHQEHNNKHHHHQQQQPHHSKDALNPLHYHRHFISGIGDGNVHNNRDPPKSIHQVDHQRRAGRLGMGHERGSRREGQERDKEDVDKDNQKINHHGTDNIHEDESDMDDLDSVMYYGHHVEEKKKDHNIFEKKQHGQDHVHHTVPTSQIKFNSIAEINEDSWQVSLLALIGIIGVLIALFINLISETPTLPSSSSSTSNSNNRYRKKYHRSDTSLSERAVKKKTDEWNEDHHTVDDNDYHGDNAIEANAVIMDQLSYQHHHHVVDGYYRQDLQEPRLRKVPVGGGVSGSVMGSTSRRTKKKSHTAADSSASNRIDSRQYAPVFVPDIGMSSSTISSSSSLPSTEKSLSMVDGEHTSNIKQTRMKSNSSTGIGLGLDGFHGVPASCSSDFNDDLHSHSSSHLSYQLNAMNPSCDDIDDIGAGIDDYDDDCDSQMSGMSSLSVTSRQSLPLGGDIITTEIIEPMNSALSSTIDTSSPRKEMPPDNNLTTPVPKYSSEISMGDGGGTTDSSLSGDESRSGRLEFTDDDEETPIAMNKPKWHPNNTHNLISGQVMRPTNKGNTHEQDYMSQYHNNQHNGQQRQQALVNNSLQSLPVPDLNTSETVKQKVFPLSPHATSVEELKLFQMESGLNEYHNNEQDSKYKQHPSDQQGFSNVSGTRKSDVYETDTQLHYDPQLPSKSLLKANKRRKDEPPEEMDSTNAGLSSSGETEGANGIIHKRRDLTAWSDAASSLTSPIAYSELKLLSIIGSGGFGQVHNATWRGTPVAVKVLAVSSKAENIQKAILQEFAAEINMVSGMRHPNICLYIGACLEPPHRAIVTELATNGSLWDALRLPLNPPYVVCDGKSNELWSQLSQNSPCPPYGTWPWMLIQRVAIGAARGMNYLHCGQPAVLHRDLKSANILLDDSFNAKITDFGLSRLKAQERSMTGNCGTVQWMAPEILANESYAEPADVYSYGIILWELLSRECPYKGMNSIQCALAVLNKNARPSLPHWCPLDIRELIEECTGKIPASRPTFSQILVRLEKMC